MSAPYGLLAGMVLTLPFPFTIYGSVAGTVLKTDESTPKFFARMSFGVWAIQSSTMKVVLVAVISIEQQGI